ncbi:ATP-binding protein [Mycolicibacterium sp. F2034L]|uniref:ATP-binding protein n=1 Tax=Mycolicibacterium sp. F2034L TaxID=2926422 RepID=UPI001FF6D71D|nr:ATP-binding protein [Mycolicibacterium sp. F2034L]MCK0176124.1 ATP-binding protein [Mycolicibacterium sp. F2034L]
MSSSHFETDMTDARFFRAAPADAHAVARLREEFSEWLYLHLDVDDVQRSDIVLVVNEALANAAEFAYRNRDAAESVTLRAVHQEPGDSLVVTVADRGEWRVSDATNQTLSRGRGIPLMEALSDRLDINTTRDGTEVQIQFDHCPVRGDDASRISA